MIEFAKTEQPLVSILIPTRNQGRLLENCLKSLLSHIGSEISYEVVIVLNAATEEVRKFVKEQVRGAIVIESEANLGVAGGYNRARSVAIGEFLALLHDDTEIFPLWLESLLETMATHPSAGSVGSYQVYPDGRPQRAGFILWDNAVASTSWGLNPKAQEDYHGVLAVDFIGTCSNLVRASAWNAIGGLDEKIFPAYYVDVDMCMNLRRVGHSVLCNPAAKVIHHQGSSTNWRFHVFIDGLNKTYFISKWSAELATHEPYAPGDPAVVARANARAARQFEDLARRYTPQPALPPPHLDAEKQQHAHFLREIELLRKYAKELETGEIQVSEQLDAAQANLEISRQSLEANTTRLEAADAEILTLKAEISKASKRVARKTEKLGEWKMRHQKLKLELKLARRSPWRKWWDRFRRRWGRSQRRS